MMSVVVTDGLLLDQQEPEADTGLAAEPEVDTGLAAEPEADGVMGDNYVEYEEDTEGGDMDEDLPSDVLDPPLYDQLPDSDAVLDDVPASDEVSGSLDADQEVKEDSQELLEDNPDASLSGPELVVLDGEFYIDADLSLADLGIDPASVTAQNAAFTPLAWQVNVASSRSFGEHYLMWAQRVSSGSSYYWRYYLAVGHDMVKSGDTYRYTDAEVYTYYSYNSSVTYDVSVLSGSVSGSAYLVYSDLYFDYVGTDPAASGFVYMVFFMFVILIAVLMIGGKRNV